jgi:predicted peptidase
MNLSAGSHTFRFSFNLNSEVDDGWDTYPPGKHEFIAELTVTPKPDYPTLSSTAEFGQHSYTSADNKLDFLLYVPESYGVDPSKQWPLIVYLHDAELRGTNPDFLRKESLPKRLETLIDFPFFVLSPSGNGDWDFWTKDEMIEPVITVLEEVQSFYPVDANRIYLTGAGMGGNGVWAMGMRNPEKFAALVPLGGYIYPFEIPENICNLTDLPIWAFHGAEDFMVPPQVEQDLVDAVNNCGGTAQLTVKSGAVIPLDAYYNSKLFDWLLTQSKK